jgi:hypothetical protein
MSQYYIPKRTRNIFIPGSDEPFKLSRTKIELFVKCPRCFYLDLRLGIGQPPGYPFTLNSAVDRLLKREFDIHRIKKSRHPLMEEYGINAIPFSHKNIETWRDTRRGISYLYEPTNFLIYGGIDDIWINQKEELHIVDYKATSKNSEITIDEDWQMGYKRQMEVYQWLFKKNGFKVSDVGYFVYCNGKADKEAFDKKIEFDVKVIPYKGDDSWVEEIIKSAHKCLMSEIMPQSDLDCDFCAYRKETNKMEAGF